MPDPPLSGGTPRATPVALFVAVLALTMVLASALAVLGIRWVTAPAPPRAIPNPLPPVSAAPTGGAAAPTAAEAVASTRLVVSPPQRLLDAAVQPGATLDVPLPPLGSPISAVLMQLSIRAAREPGPVVVSSGVEQVPAFRVRAAGAQTSATIVSVLGPDQTVRIQAVGGGRLTVDLVGTFEPAQRSASGRIVAVDATPVLRLRPKVDGNDTVIELGGVRALAAAAPVSGVMLRFQGDVGVHGGYVAVGPTAGQLNQQIFWGATSGADRSRGGFLVVPVSRDRIHLRYKAGTQLRVELVGYLTGAGAADDTTGLAVPVAARPGPAVEVPAGRTDLSLVPREGLAGVPPGRVSAVLTGLRATAGAPGAISVVAPGAATPRIPDLSAAATARSALALSAADDGTVSVASAVDATVVLTPRVLILR